jgi:hypothetical protein
LAQELEFIKLNGILVQGQYEVQLVAHDGDGDELLCLTVDFNIRPPSLTNILRSQQ